MLHLTNGDNTVAMIQAAGIKGKSFAWRDVLHDGPVPYGLDVGQLAEVRAKYIADMGWGDLESIKADFQARDEQLDDLSDVEELVLWFEHDLYDQLQILQVLDRLANVPEAKRPRSWSMICIDSFPGITRFQGLGQLQPKDLTTLLPKRSPITQDQLETGQKGWEAFRAPTPQSLQALLEDDTSALPFLAQALRRHFQQFPAHTDGLNLSERYTLEGLAAGIIQAGALFRYQNHRETHPFLGDWSYWQILVKLCSGDNPAIRFDTELNGHPAWEAKTHLTDFGKALLEEEADFVEVNGVDQWHGGTYLHGTKIPWRWHQFQQEIVETS